MGLFAAGKIMNPVGRQSGRIQAQGGYDQGQE
jgi:hypothetical protein